MGNRLNQEQRRRDLTTLASDDFDIVVIGGGVTGAGVALDAASRGLRTAVVEAQDWGSGASSRSTRLVMGGLRYLYLLDIGLVADSIRERGRLVSHLAPHLVKPQAFLWPLPDRCSERWKAAAAINTYDLITGTIGKQALPQHRLLDRVEALRLSPDLRPGAFGTAVEFHDARVDDARLVITLVRTAAEYGACALSRAEVVRMTRAEDGPVTGVVVRDLESGNELQVRTRGVIIATGVWTEQTQALAQARSGLRVVASKGTHLVVPKDRIESQTGLFTRTRDSAVTVVPTPNHWVIGATDTAWHEPLVHPVPTRADVERLLRDVNGILARPLGTRDVVTSYAGLRPLVRSRRGHEAGTTRISREYGIAQAAPGIVSVTGGKLTTYRLMAADAVDFLIGRQHAARRPSVTESTPLLGARGWAAMSNQAERIGSTYGWTPARVQQLLDRYGSELPELLEMIDEDLTLAAPVQAAPQYLRVEVARACLAEGAMHLEDIVAHRLRLSDELADRGAGAVDEVLAIAGPLLGWDAARAAREKQNYLARAEAQAASAQERNDRDAVARRLQAPDIVPSTLESNRRSRPRQVTD